MAGFTSVEQKIKRIFLQAINTGETLNFCGESYKVMCVDKPSSSSGEPKTDLYIKLLDSHGGEKEIKISVKMKNADFLENKMTESSALRIFGDDWKRIIYECTSSIRDKFEESKLIFLAKRGKTEAGSITLGWRFEILNKPGGRLSEKIDVDVGEVYKGLLLNDDKKNALVNGIRVHNSGVAEYIYVVESENSFNGAQEVLDGIELIDEYIKRYPNIYFACKASNLRTLHNIFKVEGNRSLSVYVDWRVTNNKLDCQLMYDDPLGKKSHDIRSNLINAFSQLGLKNVMESTNENIVNSSICFNER